MTATSTTRLSNHVLPLLLLLVALALLPTTLASPIKDVSTAYLAPLSALLFFGGFDNRTPFLSACGLLNLAAPFSVDAPPITLIPALPAPTSRLVPMIRGGDAGLGTFEVLVSNGITNYQLGNTSWTYVVSKNAGGSGGAPITVTQANRAGRQVDWVPFAPATISAATYPLVGGSDVLAMGGRMYPDPFTSTVRRFDLQLGGSTIVPGADVGGPSGRADAGMASVNATHVVLVGGYNANVTEGMRDVWMLNVPQMRWTRYPHQTTYPRSHLALVVYKSHVVVVGRDAPLIEVFNVATGDAPRVAEIKGTGPITLETTTATVVGDQIVLVGGNTKAGDPDQRFVRVLKVREAGGSLAFEWMSTFTPAQAASPPSTQPDSPPVTTDTLPGPGSSTFPIAAAIGASVGGVVILGGLAIIMYRRRHGRSNPQPHAPSTPSMTQPGASPALVDPPSTLSPSPMYPMPPKAPVATGVNMVLEPSTLLAAASAGSRDKCHGPPAEPRLMDVRDEDEDEVLMLPPANRETPTSVGEERYVVGTLYLPHATRTR